MAHKKAKQRDIRRTVFELTAQCVVNWPATVLERHMQSIMQTIREGIQDADPEARAASRRVGSGDWRCQSDTRTLVQAYQALSNNYQSYAEALYGQLDARTQRQLITNGNLSAASSTTSVDGFNAQRRSQDNLHRVGLGGMPPRYSMQQRRERAKRASYRSPPLQCIMATGRHQTSITALRCAHVKQCSRCAIGLPHSTKSRHRPVSRPVCVSSHRQYFLHNTI